ncbi:MAG: PIN domain-containing protein [Candidatus Nanohalobium sp.]
MILDTSFLLDLLEGDEAAARKAEKLEERQEQLKLSAATVFELHTGIERSAKPEEEKKKVKEVIDSKQVLEASHETMKKAGKLHGKLINEGSRVQAFDTVIAATSLIHEEALLTRDSDFEEIEGVETEGY